MSVREPGRRDRLVIAGFWLTIAAALIVRALLQVETAPLLGDSDDAMRMVTAADLLNGQPWQDLTQHRDNAPFGAPMHWSRLVDAPIALLLALTRPFLGPLAPDAVAVAWPLLLMLPLLALSAAFIRRLVPDAGTVTALALPIVSFVLLIEFVPGRVDHHNVQILLTLTAALALVAWRERPAGGIVAGLAIATSLAIGLEAMPMLVSAIAIYACVWIAEPHRHRTALAAFGVTLALGTAGHFLLATAPASYLTPACDMLSITYIVPALLGGFGLAATATLTGYLVRPWQRFAVLAVAGAATVGITIAFFPDCLAGPYAATNEALSGYFDTISEAQPLWVRLFTDPPTAIAFALPVLLALPVSAWRAFKARGDARADWLIVLGFLAAAALVMLLQLRGARLAAPFALPAAAWVITHARARYLAKKRIADALMLIGSWLAFAGVAHYAIAGLFSGWLDTRLIASIEASPVRQWQDCFIGEHYDELAALPQGIVAAPSWNGAHILRYTPHAVLSAGFHRNIDGIRAAETFFAGDEAAARTLAAERGIDYVAFCPANKKHSMIVGPAAGQHWTWLEPLTPADAMLVIYRVRL